MAARHVLALLLLAFALPGVIAGGAFETGVGTVIVEDRFSAPGSCALELGPLCPVGVERDGHVGNWTIDAYQQIHYVGLGTNFTRAREAVPQLWLLPDSSFYIHLDELYLWVPVVAEATEAYNALALEYPGHELYRVEMNEENTTLFYVKPTSEDPAERERSFNLTYHERGVPYDQAGPYNDLRSGSTDSYAQETKAACSAVPPAECEGVHDGAIAVSRNVTPNINVGMTLESAEFATNASNLSWYHRSNQAEPAENASTAAASGPAEDSLDPTPDADVGPHSSPRNEPARNPARPTPSAPSAPRPQDTHAQPAPLELAPGMPIAKVAASVVFAVFLSWLYSRLCTRTEIMRSKVRAQIVEEVEKNPGINLSDLTARLGVARNTVTYHTRMLQRASLLQLRETPGSLRFFPVGYSTPESGIPIQFHLHPVSGKIIEILRKGSSTRARLREMLADVPVRTQNHHIRRLLDAGVAMEERANGSIQLAHPLG